MDIHPAEDAPLVSSSQDVDSSPAIEDDNTPSSTHDHFPNPNIHNPTALETSQFWAEFTSIHGVYYMLERGHFQRWKTLAWTVFVLFMTAMLLWALITEFQDFNQYNVDTTTKTMIPISLEFPRVTICNANGGRDATRMNSTGITEPRNEEELVAISQPLEEFIFYTKFNTKVYESEMDLADIWTPIITPFGLCFSFVTDEKVFVPGKPAGLVVSAWLNQASYPDTTTWAGVQVFVTPNSKFDNGMAPSGTVILPPGDVSFVGINMQEFIREEDEPWADCVNEKNGGSRSINQCRMECFMNVTKENCSCRLIGDDNTNDDDGGLTNYNYCNSKDHECMSSIENDEQLEVCKFCSTPPCKEKSFTTRHSAGHISQNVIEAVKQLKNTPIDTVSTNFVSIHINYDSIRYEQTTEAKSTTVWQLFSNLGGSFGFFMGISLISIVELFVELIGLRLIPRLWGTRLLFGIGQEEKFD